MTEGAKRFAAVLGFPVAHSLSPKLHTHWIEKYHISNAEYVRLEVRPEDLEKTVKTLPEKGFVGFNLTIPHKEMILPLLDRIDEAARAIGAVNTVVIEKDGTFRGMNTDAYGFIENIRRNATIIRKHKAVVLGAGGAARAVCKALLDEGFSHIVLTNRTAEKSQKLAQQFGAAFDVVSWEERANALKDADLLVNTTSLGMKGHEPLTLELDNLPSSSIVNDLVYAPLETDLLLRAKVRGNQTVDGLGMLIHQGVPAFEAWFGTRPEVDVGLAAWLMEGR